MDMPRDRGTTTVRKTFTFLLLPVLAAGVMAGAMTAAGPRAALGAGHRPPAVVSPQLREQLATRDTVKVVITAWRHQDLEAIKAMGIQGASLRRLPMILARGVTVNQLARLQRSPLVRSLWHNEKHHLLMEDTTWITQARYAWGPPLGHSHAGWTGDGVDIAVIDTGVDGLHEDTDNLVQFCDVNPAGSPVVCTGGNDPGDSATARVAADDEGHGSHVSGTIAGSGDGSGGDAPGYDPLLDAHSTVGMAPNAELHVYSANIGISLLIFQILGAYDDMIDKKIAGSGVVATSNSFGGGDGANYDPNDPESVAIKAAFDVGILPVYAAGNSGPEHNTLSDACISPWAVCVGATTKPDSVAMFSSRGRPTEPADTNRNGTVGDAGDMAPDNHDRRLGQAEDLGVYRPTLVAPGVSIWSIKANSPTCLEALPAGTHSDCYEALQGTSMATPHVSGAIGLIVDAYRDGHGGATPSPSRIIEILERSSVKLPGWEAEEQGAGRLDALAAGRLAERWPDDMLPRPNLGTPSPVYAAGLFPGAADTKTNINGCTPAGSFTSGNPATHQIQVPERAERLRISIDATNDDTNNYLMLWRPGVDPTADSEPKGRSRSYPDQESTGLLNGNLPFNADRFVDVRAPEAGVWTLEVFNRVPGADPATCGITYTGVVEIPISARVPTVDITSPAPGSTHTDRFIPIRGTAAYPQRWDGVTVYEVPGTSTLPGEEIVPTETRTLHMHGNVHDGCTGQGQADLIACDGPFLLEEDELDTVVPAEWHRADSLFDGTNGRTIYDPNWIWNLEETTYIGGPMTVNWWTNSTSATGEIWQIRIWTDTSTTGRLAFSQQFALDTTGTQLATKTVNLPLIRAESDIVVHIDPYGLDQTNTVIYYDSTLPCPGSTTVPCDSTVEMPIVSVGAAAAGAGGGDAVGAPGSVRVTDRHSSLRLAWDPADGATRYRIHRSTSPSFVPSAANRIATTAGTGCTSPSVPSWPTASDGGALCYVDTGVAERVTYYYRVVGTGGGMVGEPSSLAYGAPTLFDRQVRVKADQVYGLGYWGPAGGNDSMTVWRYIWDTLGREDTIGTAGGGSPQTWRLRARSFTQGIGSAKASLRIDTDGESPTGPRDPVVTLLKSGPAEAQAGDTIRYTLRYENLGPETASDGVVTDTFPAQLKFVSASDGGTFDSATGRITWRVGDVPVGASDTLVLRATVRARNTAGTVVVNRADFTAPLTVSPPTAVAETTVVP